MRIERRKWTSKDTECKYNGSILILIDNIVKTFLRINEDEFCFLCGKMNDEEIKLINKEEFTFGEKRQIITMLNTYFSDYKPTDSDDESKKEKVNFIFSFKK